jgi:hypothetical protein
VCAELLGRLSTCEPAFAAQIARLASEAGHRPPAAWLAVFLEEAAAVLPAFGPEDLVSLLAALAAWRYRPGEAQRRRFEAAAARRLPAFSAAQLARLLARLRALGWQLQPQRGGAAARAPAPEGRQHAPRQGAALAPAAGQGRGLAAACLEAAPGALRWAAPADVAALLAELPAALEAAGWAPAAGGAAPAAAAAPLPGPDCGSLDRLQAALPRHLVAMAPQQRVAAAAGLARLRLLLLGTGRVQPQGLPAPLAGSLRKHLGAAERSGALGEDELQLLRWCWAELGLELGRRGVQRSH